MGMDRRLAQLARPIIWCDSTDRIQDVARRIGVGTHSCALVRTGDGLGIVTDHDFRLRVATGEVDLGAPVSDLATVPVLTIDEQATQAAALLRMVEHAVHHLVVTSEAGPVGVVRAVDLAEGGVRDPLMTRAGIENADTIDELAKAARTLPATIAELQRSHMPAVDVGAIHTAMIDAIIRRVLELNRDPVLAEVRCSWIVLGSLARREPLPLSDLDTALVWASSPNPEEILQAAGRVLADLERCGLRPCPAGTRADNPAFGRSEAEWTAAMQAWQRDRDQERALLMSATVADSRPLTEPGLSRCLTDPIAAMSRNTRLLRALLDEALGFRPPTGFVRDFVVRHRGEHRGQLDLKKGGLAPVVALGRWIAIATGDAHGTTPQRLRRGAEAGLLTADEAQTLSVAFEEIYSLVLAHEVNAAATTFISPKDLDTLTRRYLREAFRAVRSIQSALDEHWLARLERAGGPRSHTEARTG